MVIGVKGKAGSGKDEFAKVAQKHFGATRVAFGDVLKAEVAEVFKRLGVSFLNTHLHGTQQDKESPLLLYIPHIQIADGFVWRFMEEHGTCQGVLGWFVNRAGRFKGRLWSFLNSALPPGNHSFCVFTPRAFLQWYGTDYRRAQDSNYWVRQGMALCEDPSKMYVITDCRYPNELLAVRNMPTNAVVEVVRPDAPQISNMGHVSENAVNDWRDIDVTIRNDSSLDEYRKRCLMALQVVKRERGGPR